MKSIRSLFILIIGMMVLTVTATTTAKLEQKQKVEFTIGSISNVNELQVVKLFPAFSNEVAVVKNVEILKSFYTASIDVGLDVNTSILYTIHSKLPENLDKDKALVDKRRSIQSYCYLQEKKRDKNS